MTTSLKTLRQLLCADIGDIIPTVGACNSTTTSSGSSTTLVDTALIPVPSDFFKSGAGSELPTLVKATSGTYDGQVRAVSSFTASSGTVTVSSAFGGTIASAVTYELHNIGDPTLKDWCIQQACYDAYPHLYARLDDSTIRYGDHLIDGHMNYWSSAAALGYWTASSTTLTRTSNTNFGGTYVCALSTTAGYVGQSTANNSDLMQLASKSVTFYARVKTTTASQVRLAIYDGTTTTYSDYHSGSGGWELLSVTATIEDNPTDVAFRVYYAATTSTAYVTDCYVSGPEKYEYEIAYLDLPNDVPNQVFAMSSQDGNAEFPNPLDYGTKVETWEPFGTKIRFTQALDPGTKLRLVGRKYVTQPDSSTSTDPEAPQIQIISALAAVRLFKSLASSPSHSIQYFAEQVSRWEAEARRRISRHGMQMIPITRYRGV